MEKKKKSLFKRWWFWALVIIIVIGIITSGDDQDITEEPASVNQPSNETDIKPDTNEEAEEKIYKIGDSFDTGDLSVTVLEVEEKTEFKSDNEFIDDVTTEGKFIVVKAKITNNDKESRTISSSMFKIVDDQEREYETLIDMNLSMILGDDDLFLESINPGMSRTGVFVFEVPADIESYSLKVYSGTAFAADTSVTVKLK